MEQEKSYAHLHNRAVRSWVAGAARAARLFVEKFVIVARVQSTLECHVSLVPCDELRCARGRESVHVVNNYMFPSGSWIV